VATFPSDVIADLAEREEIQLQTAAPSRPGGTRKTIIWVMVDGKDVFVRSVRGEQGRWYRELLVEPKAVVHFRGKPKREPVRVRAVRASDPKSIERCSRALVSKYTGIPGLKEMLEEDTLPTTVRLEPL
jgi:hypothetical protein